MAKATFTPSGDNARLRSWMQSIEDRVETMETQQRLFNASVKGGAIVVLDDDGKQVGRLGVGTYGTVTAPVLSVTSPEQAFHLLIDTKYGFVFPTFHSYMVQDTYVPITSASYVNVFKAIQYISGQALIFQTLVTADASTVGKVRLELGGTHYTDEITINGGEQKVCAFAWDLTNKVNIGTKHALKLQALRVSGTGNINVYAPDWTFTVAKNVRTDITPGGIPVGP